MSVMVTGGRQNVCCYHNGLRTIHNAADKMCQRDRMATCVDLGIGQEKLDAGLHVKCVLLCLAALHHLECDQTVLLIESPAKTSLLYNAFSYANGRFPGQQVD